MNNLSIHAEKRLQQRGISELEVSVLELCGIEQHIGKGAVRIHLEGKRKLKVAKQLRELIERLERGELSYMIKNGNKILTVAHQTQKFKRDRKRARR